MTCSFTRKRKKETIAVLIFCSHTDILTLKLQVQIVSLVPCSLPLFNLQRYLLSPLNRDRRKPEADLGTWRHFLYVFPPKLARLPRIYVVSCKQISLIKSHIFLLASSSISECCDRLFLISAMLGIQIRIRSDLILFEIVGYGSRIIVPNTFFTPLKEQNKQFRQFFVLHS